MHFNFAPLPFVITRRQIMRGLVLLLSYYAKFSLGAENMISGPSQRRGKGRKGSKGAAASGSRILASAFSGDYVGVEFVQYSVSCFATSEMLDEIDRGYDFKLSLNCEDSGVCTGYIDWAADLSFVGVGGSERTDWFGSVNEFHGLAGSHQINTKRSFILADTEEITLRYFFWEEDDINTLFMEVHRPGVDFAFGETTYVKVDK